MFALETRVGRFSSILIDSELSLKIDSHLSEFGSRLELDKSQSFFQIFVVRYKNLQIELEIGF